jgi:hypothetical protein
MSSYDLNNNKYNNTINISIETITGRSFPLKVSLNDTIQQVKIKIQRSEGIPVTHQQLIWQQNELDDKFTLRDYNINDGSTIKMVLLLRGGPINSRRCKIISSFSFCCLFKFYQLNILIKFSDK